jgi:hypothetical protein
MLELRGAAGYGAGTEGGTPAVLGGAPELLPEVVIMHASPRKGTGGGGPSLRGRRCLRRDARSAGEFPQKVKDNCTIED